MKADYCPDGWVLIKIISPEETLYKVFSSWGGGWVQGEYWKLNSGIESIEIQESYLDVKGYSGSVYRLSYNGEERINSYNTGVLSSFFNDDMPEGVSVEKISLEKFLKEFKNPS